MTYVNGTLYFSKKHTALIVRVLDDWIQNADERKLKMTVTELRDFAQTYEDACELFMKVSEVKSTRTDET